MGGRCNTALCGIQVLYFRDFGYQGSINVSVKFITNRPFSHCFCARVYRSRGTLFPDNRRDLTAMGQTDFKSLILSM